ncbi:MAG: hypothetical protein ACQESC_04915, partial [Nanobdellota archaeon]
SGAINFLQKVTEARLSELKESTKGDSAENNKTPGESTILTRWRFLILNSIEDVFQMESLVQ